MKSKFVTLKEIANAVELSPRTIIRREHNLGLDSCLDKICRKPRRYRRDDAEDALEENGFDVSF